MANVTVQQNAFLFCRYGVAAMVWAALFLESARMLALVFAIMALSALLTVRRAPMIVLWTYTLGRLIPSKDVVLDIKGMRFAHTLGAVFALVCLSMAYRQAPGAWIVVTAFAVLKTLSAVGLCPAYKLYACVGSGGCCAITGKRQSAE